MSRLHTITAPMSRGAKPVRLRIDLAIVKAITDAREIDGSVLIESDGNNWLMYQMGDDDMHELESSWEQARCPPPEKVIAS